MSLLIECTPDVQRRPGAVCVSPQCAALIPTGQVA